ncbi:MAG: hypothetical protein OCC49_19360 [Fibrobacterales bacterium]
MLTIRKLLPFLTLLSIISCDIVSKEPAETLSSQDSSVSYSEGTNSSVTNADNSSHENSSSSTPSSSVSSAVNNSSNLSSTENNGESSSSSSGATISSGESLSSSSFTPISSEESKPDTYKERNGLLDVGSCNGVPVTAPSIIHLPLTVYDHTNTWDDFGSPTIRSYPSDYTYDTIIVLDSQNNPDTTIRKTSTGLNTGRAVTGMVKKELGLNGLPQLDSIHTDNDHLEEWWTEAEFNKVNTTIPFLYVGNGTYQYWDNNFFPLDSPEATWKDPDTLNYYFAAHFQHTFLYDGTPNQLFEMGGEDDIFVYLNGTLVIELGGPQYGLLDTFSLSEEFQQLGIEVGDSITLDFFIAERKMLNSKAYMSITAPCFFNNILPLAPADSYDASTYAHCTENEIPVKETLCNVSYSNEHTKEINTIEENKKGLIYLTPLQDDFSSLISSCTTCKGNDTLTITKGVIKYTQSGWEQISAPLHAISPHTLNSDTHTTLFTFAIDEMFESIHSTSIEDYFPNEITLWNSDSTYSLTFEPRNLNAYRKFPESETTIDWKLVETHCTHSACSQF